ncbi:MAG TPA: DUF441 domain-containing protein [Bacillota bacterium]|nr:DUF441 domain-containing protein [Bacillota bacterium]
MPREVSFLLIVLALGLIGGNHLVWTAALILMGIRLLGLECIYSGLEQWGVRAGLTLLVVAILTPFVSGSLTFQGIWAALRTPSGAVAAIMGALASYLGRFGIEGMQVHPEMALGLVIGSILGASLLGGVPTGPLIAAGAAVIILRSLGIDP